MSQASNSQWVLSSLAYKRIDDNLYVKSRKGIYKGQGASDTLTTAADAFFDSGELNPTRSQASSGATVPWYWSANFVRFAAKYSLTDMTGIYSAGWVAGVNAEDSRIFNMSITSTGTSLGGQALFGFGYPMQDPLYDGLVSHFYCNWTSRMTSDSSLSPSTASAQKGYKEGAQYQAISLTTAARWVPTQNNLRFAPSSTCGKTGVVDTAGTGNFSYSTQWDQALNSGAGGMSATLSSATTTDQLLTKGSSATFKDRVKSTIAWTSTTLIP